MEKIIEYNNLRKIIHKLCCNKCGVEMIKDNIVLMTSPPQYTYNCPKCESRLTSYRQYPWEEIVGDEVKCVVQDMEDYRSL